MAWIPNTASPKSFPVAGPPATFSPMLMTSIRARAAANRKKM